MTTFFAALGRFAVRFRYLIIAAWIVFAVLAVEILPSLDSVVKTTQSDFLPGSSPSLQAQKLELRFNHKTDNLAPLTLVAVAKSGVLTSTQQSAITQLEGKIRRLAHVKSVEDLSVSPDLRARQAQIWADVPQTVGPSTLMLIKHVRAGFAGAPPGLTYHLTGDLAIGADTKQKQQSADSTAQLLSIAVIIVLLLLAFRALLAPVITLITAMVALVISGPVIALSTHLHIPVSSITSGVLIVLLLGAGTDYCVFLLSRMREEVSNGLTPKDAVARAVATVGESISFSGLTVIASLSCLVLAKFGIYRSLGPALAIGVGVMLVAGLTLLPALLAVFGNAVFWPARPKVTAVRHDGIWGRIAGRFIARPWVTLIVGVAVFGGLSLGMIGAPTTGGFTSSSPSGTDSARGEAALRAHFPTAGANPELAILSFRTSVWTNPAPAAAAEQRLVKSHLFRSVVGPFGPGGFSQTEGFTSAQIAGLYKTFGPPQRMPASQHSGRRMQATTYDAYRGLAQYFSADGKTIQFFTTPRHNNVDSAIALRDVGSLRSELTRTATAVGATSSGLFGVLPIAYDISHTSSSDLQQVIPIVLVMIAFLLALVLRSLVAPLYLVASVVLSYFATLGLAGYMFVHFGGQPNLNFVLPLVIFMFLMALGSDYNILVMSRIREEAASLPIAQAVKRAIGATGTTVTTAGLILGGTFASFGLAGTDMQSKEIGYGIAAGILLDTFLVRTLLVPSIVVLLGRWNWWPSSHQMTDPAAELEEETELELATA